MWCGCFFCQAEDGIRDLVRSRGLGDVYKRQLNQSGVAEGVFLSSGVAGGGIRTMDKLLDTADILRKKHQYKGYLHLKIMPGSEKDQVYRAMQLADRV